MQSSSQTLVRRWRGLVAALVAAAPLLAPAVALASTNYTWSGAAAPGTLNWSNGTNWGGTAPSGAVGTLTFPELTSPACTANPATATCYASTNDILGLNVNAISIDDGHQYGIVGDAITLGGGGITASTSAWPAEYAFINFPITLSAPQTWSIDGNHTGANLILGGGNVTGVSDALAIDLAHAAYAVLDGSNVEVGPVTVTGDSTPTISIVDLSGSASLQTPAELNATDGNSVSFRNGSGLGATDGRIGPLTISGGLLQVGDINEAGTLAVAGGVSLDATSELEAYINKAGTSAGTDYSQISASGIVNLGGARLSISATNPGGGSCAILNLGEVDTLVTTAGTLEGTFKGVPNGTTVTTSCIGSSETPPTLRINYTAHAVTATVVEASQPAPLPTTTALAVSNATPAVGEAVTYTATVAPEALVGVEPSGSVAFLDGGTPIGTCSTQPLTAGLSSSSASCTVSYAAAGVHTITAMYTGDVTYAGSSSTAQTVTVHASSAGGGSTGGGGSTTPTTPPAPTGTVTLSGTTITARSNGKASVTLTCTGTATCGGTLTLTAKGTKKGKKKRPKTTTIGTGNFSIPAGKSAHVALTLNAAGRALLRADHGRLSATLTILTSSPAPVRTQHVSVHLAQRGTKAKRR